MGEESSLNIALPMPYLEHGFNQFSQLWFQFISSSCHGYRWWKLQQNYPLILHLHWQYMLLKEYQERKKFDIGCILVVGVEASAVFAMPDEVFSIKVTVKLFIPKYRRKKLLVKSRPVLGRYLLETWMH